MNIRDISRKYDISMDTLRYYERMELLGVKHEGNQRVYEDFDCQQLDFILLARNAGVPINVLKSYMVAWRGEYENDILKETAMRKELVKILKYMRESAEKVLKLLFTKAEIERLNQNIEDNKIKEDTQKLDMYMKSIDGRLKDLGANKISSLNYSTNKIETYLNDGQTHKFAVRRSCVVDGLPQQDRAFLRAQRKEEERQVRINSKEHIRELARKRREKREEELKQMKEKEDAERILQSTNENIENITN